MRLFSGSSHRELATQVAKALKIKLGKVELKEFSCGEQYVRFEESIRAQDVYILQTSGLNPDDNLMELFLMCQAAKLSFAKSVHVVMPNFPYARQDRVAHWREPISAKLVARLLEEAGADHVLTCDFHSDQIQGFFSVPVDVIDTTQIFAKYIKGKKFAAPVIVSPDAGGAKKAKKFADTIGAELALMHKTRPGHNKSEVLEVVGEVEGKNCILYDDMIDTAGTLANAKQALLDRGAHQDVYAAATHPIFSGPAIKRLTEAKFKEVIVTDTMPLGENTFPGLKILSIATLLAQVIKSVQGGKSVTEIYEK